MAQSPPPERDTSVSQAARFVEDALYNTRYRLWQLNIEHTKVLRELAYYKEQNYVLERRLIHGET